MAQQATSRAEAWYQYEDCIAIIPAIDLEAIIS